jgi:hypothetical protein
MRFIYKAKVREGHANLEDYANLGEGIRHLRVEDKEKRDE